MESYLKEVFNVYTVKDLHCCSSGCISEGKAYNVGDRKLFIKTNSKPEADVMFKGEMEGLNEILSTNTIKVPKPVLLFDGMKKRGFALALEYLDIRNLTTYNAELGENLAQLHLHNINRLKEEEKNQNRVNKNKSYEEENYKPPIKEFGFHTTTCCGYVPLDNTWNDNWVEFYARQRLENKINLIQAEYGDRELNELWSELHLKLHKLFKDISVQPALVHGDLWSGNAGQLDDAPVIFDPGAFYAHHEFELSITDMFGSFHGSFYKSYHNFISKEKGFEDRHQLYLLFHFLNHWHHFGRSYRSNSITIIKKLLQNIN